MYLFLWCTNFRYIRQWTRLQKIILAKNCPATVLLPVSDRKPSPGPQKPPRTSPHSYWRVQLHRMRTKWKNCIFDLPEPRNKIPQKNKKIIPECISSILWNILSTHENMYVYSIMVCKTLWASPTRSLSVSLLFTLFYTFSSSDISTFTKEWALCRRTQAATDWMSLCVPRWRRRR